MLPVRAWHESHVCKSGIRNIEGCSVRPLGCDCSPFPHGRVVAKIVCAPCGHDTLVQYAVCRFSSSRLSLSSEGLGEIGIIRFRSLWWGRRFTFFSLRSVWYPPFSLNPAFVVFFVLYEKHPFGILLTSIHGLNTVRSPFCRATDCQSNCISRCEGANPIVARSYNIP